MLSHGPLSRGSAVKNPSAMQEAQEMQVWSLGLEDPLEEEMAANPLQYSCWPILWTEEPGGLQSPGLQRVGHDWNDWEHMHMWASGGT